MFRIGRHVSKRMTGHEHNAIRRTYTILPRDALEANNLQAIAVGIVPFRRLFASGWRWIWFAPIVGGSVGITVRNTGGPWTKKAFYCLGGNLYIACQGVVL